MNTFEDTSSAKIVMCGTHETGWETIKFLLEQGVGFDYFVTVTEEKAKKLNISGFKSFEDLAATYNIPVYFVESYALKNKKDLRFFEEHKFDLLVQGGWQRLFPPSVLQTLRVGGIGVHGSSEFLPKGRGRSPINWSLLEGKKRFIMHYYLMQPGADDGDIFHYEMFDINEWDTCKTLYYKNSIITRRVLRQWIPRLLAGNFQLVRQQGDPTYYPKRSPEDGLIDWSKTVFEIYNFVRALTRPYPGAFTFCNKRKMMLWEVQPFDARIAYFGARQGEVVECFYNGDFVVNCNSGLLLVTVYEYENGENQSPEIKVGDILGPGEE